MRVCVAGLWHLGTVTAACLAAVGHDVTGFDEPAVVDELQEGHPPIFEPDLEESVRSGLDSGRLRFTSDAREALSGARVLWITYDTPVDDDDRADPDSVVKHVESLLKTIDAGTLVILSSQLPVGTTKKLEAGARNVSFACLPENLRLGKAIDAFLRPDRIVAGIRSDKDRSTVAELLAPISAPIEWMSVESAEMTKHALNAFLATSVAFANEIAAVCENVGADAHEVARGLKSDVRIGRRAYLSPGAAFAGGTLARDVEYLIRLGAGPVIAGAKASNDAHRQWTQRTLITALGDLRRKTVAIFGLTYKPGTDTLRRSAAVELCRWLLSQQARVQAHDPAVRELPADLAPVRLLGSTADALRDADAVVIATEWPEYKSLRFDRDDLVVIDPNRFVADAVNDRVRYYSVGRRAR